MGSEEGVDAGGGQRDWTGGVGPGMSRRRVQDVPCHRFWCGEGANGGWLAEVCVCVWAAVTVGAEEGAEGSRWQRRGGYGRGEVR